MRIDGLAIIADLYTIQADLRSYGEEELAERVMDATEAQHRSVLSLVTRFWDHRLHVGAAAIEEMTGERRLPGGLSSVAAIRRRLGPPQSDAESARHERVIFGGLTRTDVSGILDWFGERDLSKRATTLSAPRLLKIQKAANRGSRLLAVNLVFAAIAVFEKKPRMPRFARRKIKGVYR